MLREGDISDIFDGHFYGPEDPAPVGCGDCAGCSACCRNTGDTIILDPYDMYMLCRGTGKTFQQMLEREIEIRLVDGLVLPNLMQHHEFPLRMEKMHGARKMPERPASEAKTCLREEAGAQESGDHCPFLSAAGRCTIHSFRPGLCRLYPLGRYYREGGFVYICQKDECREREKTPVRVRDWLGVEDLPRYEAFLLGWHDFKKQGEAAMERLTPKSRESVRRYILQIFYVHPWLSDVDFYAQYEARLEVCRDALKEILVPLA